MRGPSLIERQDSEGTRHRFSRWHGWWAQDAVQERQALVKQSWPNMLLPMRVTPAPQHPKVLKPSGWLTVIFPVFQWYSYWGHLWESHDVQAIRPNTFLLRFSVVHLAGKSSPSKSNCALEKRTAHGLIKQLLSKWSEIRYVRCRL